MIAEHHGMIAEHRGWSTMGVGWGIRVHPHSSASIRGG